MGSEAGDLEAVGFYWRPGCGACAALDHQLQKLGVPIDRHNIWENPDAAAFVRSVDRGNETVPTVALGEVTLVNPSRRQVVAVLAERAPHLLPEGIDAPQLNRFQRTVQRLLGG